MKFRRTPAHDLVFFILLLAAHCITGCYRSVPQEFIYPEISLYEFDPEKPAWPVLAILETGINPLWFEFTFKGPRLIPSPDQASLVDFSPWPFACYSTGMLVFPEQPRPGISSAETPEQFLAMAVNKFGFLIMGRDEEQNLVLYSAANPIIWDPYSVASFFLYQDKPGVLLCHDNFFSNQELPPECPVYNLDQNFPLPVNCILPALNIFSVDGEGEFTALWQGSDQNWYYRFADQSQSSPSVNYYRTSDLSLPGEKIDQGVYRNYSVPEPVTDELPVIYSLALEIQKDLSGISGVPVLNIVSQNFSAARNFAVSSASEGDFIMLSGFYREGTCSDPESDPVNIPGGNFKNDPGNKTLAFAILPDGKGFLYTDETFSAFSLPSLPEGFAYTGAALAGDVLVATWEEQEDYSIGAAGFLAMKADILGL